MGAIANPLDFMNQEWVLLGPYLFSKNGEVYSPVSKKIIKGRVGNHGYRYLTIDGVNWLLHRIIAMCFLNTLPKEQVNHIDGNKLNNKAENLEWVSRSENVRHAYSRGLNVRRYFTKKSPDVETILTLRTFYPVANYDHEYLKAKDISIDRASSINTRNFKNLPFVTVEEIEQMRNL